MLEVVRMSTPTPACSLWLKPFVEIDPIARQEDLLICLIVFSLNFLA